MTYSSATSSAGSVGGDDHYDARAHASCLPRTWRLQNHRGSSVLLPHCAHDLWYDNNSKKYRELGLLHKMKWSRVVFDEAHHLRNKKTRMHIGALKLQSSIRWLMTGTPIQNKKEDFYGLCAVMGIPVRILHPHGEPYGTRHELSS